MTYPELSAVRLLDECRAAGYAGGYSQLKAYVARIRPRPAPEPIVRFETAPGHQAQFDFAKIRLPWGTRFALLVVLGYSRVLFVDFVARQTALAVGCFSGRGQNRAADADFSSTALQLSYLGDLPPGTAWLRYPPRPSQAKSPSSKVPPILTPPREDPAHVSRLGRLPTRESCQIPIGP